MGRKQKLKMQRRIEEQHQASEKKEKRKKTIIAVVMLVLILFAIWQVSIAFNNYNNRNNTNKNVENNSAQENTASDEAQKDSAQSMEPTEPGMESTEPGMEPTNQEPADNNEENDAVENENIQNKIAVIETDKGDIKLEFYAKDAPKTVENFIRLASEKFYDGTKFHRVISDFMIQGGDPLSKDGDPNNDGTGNPGYSFEDEINPWSLGLPENTIKSYEGRGYKYTKDLTSHKVEVGSLAMANSGPNTNGSQFFIVTQRSQPHLDGLHTVFGKVVEGMDVVRKIQQGDVMKRVYIAE